VSFDRIGLILSTPRPDRPKMFLKYWQFPVDSRLCTMLFNENPFAAGSASGRCPEYSNSVCSYQRNCHGCYWQNPIISSTYIARKRGQ